MSPRNDVVTANISELWDENMLSAHNTGTLTDESKFSEVMNEDFLLIDDDGLEISDDFSGLLDINPSSEFDLPEGKRRNQESSEQESLPQKRSNEVNMEYPAQKKLKSIYEGTGSGMSIAALTAMASQSSASSLGKNILEPQDKYKLALQHLALSMRRSEQTRNEIIRHRKENEARARARAAQFKTVSNAECFLTGNTKTLTVGLEQSRNMLLSLIGKAKSQPLYPISRLHS